MFRSPYSRILHDPECQSPCCSESFSRPMDTHEFTDLEQCSDFITSYNDANINSSSTFENQFLYEVNTEAGLVPEFQFQQVLTKKVVNKLKMMNSKRDYEKPIKQIRYAPYSISVNLAEARCKEKSYCKTITKRKRNRTVFSTEQIILMEKVFNKRPYVSREERLFLAQRLHISEKAIKIWFQNRRRVTEKKDKDQSDSYHSDSSIEECSDYITRLDYVESHIVQNTDEYGVVTLDSKVLTELVKLIDHVLSKNIDYHDASCENKSNTSYLMYEPVSPDSFSDDNKGKENISKWKPSKPEESLQRLIDIHTVLYS